MNKKLLAAAVAAAVVAIPAAYAEPTVYGKFHTSVDAVDTSASPGGTVEDNYQVNSRASRLGFKGAEDLGSGLKAIYQIEFGVDTAGDDADGLGRLRNTFVGLAGDFGTMLVGRHDTPAKMAFYAAGTEVLGDSIIDLNQVFSEVRSSNIITYVSPNFSGFTVAAAVVPGERSGVAGSGISTITEEVSLFGATTTVTFTGTPSNDADGLADSYSIGLMYSGYGLKIGVGYENLVKANVTGPDTDDSKMLQVGASYTIDNIMVGAHYEQTDNWLTVNNLDYTAWGIVAKATFGNNAISAIYLDAEAEFAGADVGDGDGWGLSAEHNFSKRTKAYAAYLTADGEIPGTVSVENDTFSVGMIHSF